MSKIKIVTICGSMKYKKEMMKISEQLELNNGYAVIQCVYGKNNNYSTAEKEKLKKYILKKLILVMQFML